MEKVTCHMCGKVQRKVLIKTDNGSLFGTMDQYHMTCKKCNKTVLSFSLPKQKEQL